MSYWVWIGGHILTVHGEGSACKMAEMYPTAIVFMATPWEAAQR